MDKTPLVSILIPLYNNQEYIADTIESCLAQSYKNIEIIIVDDGSNDNSANIAKNYAKRYSNIKFYQQKHSGAPTARNLAFKKSKGRYIQYLDSDDLISKNKIATQIEIAKEYNYNPSIILSSKFSYFKDDIKSAKYFKQEIDHSYTNSINWLIDSWSGGGFGVVMGWLTHRDLIKKAGYWDETLKKNQDGEFFCRVILNSKQIIMSDNTMVYYRKRGNKSISSNNTKESIYSLLHSLRKYKSNIKDLNNIRLQEALAISFANFIREYYYKYPLITKEAEKEIIDLGFNIDKLPYKGKFGYMVKLLGFYNAVKIYRIIKE